MTNKIINLDEVRKRRQMQERDAQGGLFQKLSRIDELEDVLDTMDEFAASSVEELVAALDALDKNAAQGTSDQSTRSVQTGQAGTSHEADDALVTLADLGITTRDELAALIDRLEADSEGKDFDGAE